jgi:hypothetical protein
MYCTKFSCLLLVVAQKSSRSIVSFSVLVRPSSPTITVLLFLGGGHGAGLVIGRLAALIGQGLAYSPKAIGGFGRAIAVHA